MSWSFRLSYSDSVSLALPSRKRRGVEANVHAVCRSVLNDRNRICHVPTRFAWQAVVEHIVADNGLIYYWEPTDNIERRYGTDYGYLESIVMCHPTSPVLLPLRKALSAFVTVDTLVPIIVAYLGEYMFEWRKRSDVLVWKAPAIPVQQRVPPLSYTVDSTAGMIHVEILL